MKKTLKFKIAISIAVVAVAGVFVLKPRSYNHMERVANNSLYFILKKDKLEDKLRDFHKVPTKETIDKKSLIFSWRYLLENGDTAVINIEVRKQVYPWENKDNDIYMNRKWGYLSRPESRYIQILPLKYKGDSLYLYRVVPVENQNKYLNSTDSIQLLIPTKKLFYFLKEGYFNVLKRYEDITVVAFYEPIAITMYNNRVTHLKTAKLFFNDKYEVSIIPYDAPQELWDNYNKE